MKLSTKCPSSSSPQTYVRNLSWRPATEGYAACTWLASSATSFALAAATGLESFFLLTGAASLAAGAIRAKQVCAILRERSCLAGKPLEFVGFEDFTERLDRYRTASGLEDSVFFGMGFEWETDHAQRLYDILRTGEKSFIPPAWIRKRLIGHTGPNLGDYGKGYLHGIEKNEVPILAKEKTLEGGTLIVGTTQSGKGVLQCALVTQSVLRGDTVIVIDPKNSSRLRGCVEAAAKKAGRGKVLMFHPASTDTGVRLNLLSDFTRASELASRVTSVMSDDGVFTQFAWEEVVTMTALAVRVKVQPSFALFERIMALGIGELLEKALRLSMGDEEFETAASGQNENGTTGLDGAIDAWLATGKQDSEPAIVRAIANYQMPPEHHKKLTASLGAALSKFCDGNLAKLLSPDASDTSDLRPICTLSEVIRDNRILYVCLDSLSDLFVSNGIGSILLAGLSACAGQRYNSGNTSGRISLFVDECSNVINDPLIQILNKGAESGIRTTCAMQTVSDLEAKLGSRAKAEQALGNFNNKVFLRTVDARTQQYAAGHIGNADIVSVDASISSAQKSDDAAVFSASYGQRTSSSSKTSIPFDQMGRLPNCEFFAFLGGRTYKGRIPILDPKIDSAKTEGRYA